MTARGWLGLLPMNDQNGGEQRDIMKPREVADFLRLSPAQVRTMAARDQIPAWRVGGQWRFSRSRILAWLDENHERPPSRDSSTTQQQPPAET